MAKRPRTETIKRIVIFEAQANQFKATLKSIDQSSAAAARSLKRIDTATKQTSISVAKVQASIQKFSNILKGLGLFYLGSQFVWLGKQALSMGEALASTADSLKLIDTRITRLGAGTATMGDMANLADELGLRYADAADNVALLAPAFERLGIPFGRVTDFASDFTKSLRVFGTDARRAQIVTVQLAQALSSGKLAGDELRSLVENAGGLGLELERAVQQILGSNKALKDLGSEGVLTTEVLLEAFDKVFNKLEKDFKNLPPLLEQQKSRMANAWSRVVATLDERWKVSKFFQDLYGGITNQLNDINARLAQGIGGTAGGAAMESSINLFSDEEIQKRIDMTLEKLTKINEEIANAPKPAGGLVGNIFGNKEQTAKLEKLKEDLKVLNSELRALQKIQETACCIGAAACQL